MIPAGASAMEDPANIALPQTPIDESFKTEPTTDPAEDELTFKTEHHDSSPTESLSTPSESASAFPHTTSKRSTRKSTLTQQQKNSKRQRATQDQLNTLEIEFSKNPTPNAAIRERIATEINMTERSVQIWFQNRRAKIKNRAKKSYEAGEEADIPDAMRQYLAVQALESGNVLAVPPDYFTPGALVAYGTGLLVNPETSPKVMISHLPCRSLSVGTWRRIGQTQLDLVVFYSPTKSMMTYYIQAENTGFRIEYPFSSIKSIFMESNEAASNADIASSDNGCIIVELLHPPMFTMDQGSSGWFNCRDFTEDQQASKILVHRLGGNSKALSAQLAKLTSTDAFRSRFEMPMMKPAMGPPLGPPLPQSMPMVEQRPSSQPNHLVHPHMGPIPEHSFESAQKMGPPIEPHRGHKRQRSSSVPMAINFGARRQPITPFTLQQHYHQHNHIHHHNPNPNFDGAQNHIFSPTPHHPMAAMPYHQQAAYGHLGPPLQVDVSSGFNFDFNIPPPPSATTGTTPPSSEFEHTLYPPSQLQDLYSAPPTQTTFPSTFLSPVMDSPALLEHSVSPASNHEPPPQESPAHLASPATIYRSHSADPRVQTTNDNQYYNDLFSMNAENFVDNSKLLNGFDGPKFDFMDSINWPTDDAGNVDALLINQGPRGHSRLNSINLAYRFSAHNEKPQQPTTPSQEFEFSDLVSLTPEHDQPKPIASMH